MSKKASKAIKAELAARSDWREAGWFTDSSKARDRANAKRTAKRAARRFAKELLSEELLDLAA